MHNSAHCYNTVLDNDQAMERIPISTNSDNNVNTSLEINLSIYDMCWTNSPRVTRGPPLTRKSLTQSPTSVV